MSAMCKRMLEKFYKYWSEYSVVLAFGVVLDLRFKFKVLKKLYAKVETNPSKCQAYIELLRKKLYKLYDQYVSAIGSSSSQPSSSTIMHSRVESQDVLDFSDEIVGPVEKYDDDVDEDNNGDEGDELDDMNEDESNDGTSCV
nr:zinc finger BED domain-containing protein RICESLEEPER 2-like [Ipomoea batatas]